MSFTTRPTTTASETTYDLFCSYYDSSSRHSSKKQLLTSKLSGQFNMHWSDHLWVPKIYISFCLYISGYKYKKLKRCIVFRYNADIQIVTILNRTKSKFNAKFSYRLWNLEKIEIDKSNKKTTLTRKAKHIIPITKHTFLEKFNLTKFQVKSHICFCCIKLLFII